MFDHACERGRDRSEEAFCRVADFFRSCSRLPPGLRRAADRRAREPGGRVRLRGPQSVRLPRDRGRLRRLGGHRPASSATFAEVAAAPLQGAGLRQLRALGGRAAGAGAGFAGCSGAGFGLGELLGRRGLLCSGRLRRLGLCRCDRRYDGWSFSFASGFATCVVVSGAGAAAAFAGGGAADGEAAGCGAAVWVSAATTGAAGGAPSSTLTFTEM